MRLHKLIFIAVFISGYGLSPVQAQNMYVKESSGVQTAYALSDIRKITFSPGNLTVQKTNNSTRLYPFSGLRYLSFQNYLTGSEEQIQPGNARIFTYPNPVEDVLNIDLSGSGNKSGSISLLSVEGKLLREQVTNGTGLVTLNLSGLPNGIYFWRYVGTSIIKTGKIIKR